MDPGALMSNGSLITNGSGNMSSYNLAEIWQFPMICGTSVDSQSGDGLGVKMGQLGYGYVSDLNREVSDDDRMRTLEQRMGYGSERKRTDADDVSPNDNDLEESEGKRVKTSTRRDENRELKNESTEEASSAKPPLAPPVKQDFIHVRARRGQATDSHSLAERARREKISERMKILQDLVPGCSKVIGKAVVLDEIINYIHSLQRQIEFLSMKLEAVNSRTCPALEVFPSKDFGEQTYENNVGMAAYDSSQPRREYDNRGSSPEWLHMQIGGGFQRST